MERNLSFCFKYDQTSICPHSVQVIPDPHGIPDYELVLTANTCIQALASKHGLERAIEMINDAAYGNLFDGTKFDTLWSKNLEQEGENET